jgi:hypothetical protein
LLAEAIDTGTTSGRFLFNTSAHWVRWSGRSTLNAPAPVWSQQPLVVAVVVVRRSMDDAKIRAARAMMASGNLSASEVAKHVGCAAASTLYRHPPGGRSEVEQVAA